MRALYAGSLIARKRKKEWMAASRTFRVRMLLFRLDSSLDPTKNQAARAKACSILV
jgi:hypothetical protein